MQTMEMNAVKIKYRELYQFILKPVIYSLHHFNNIVFYQSSYS